MALILVLLHIVQTLIRSGHVDADGNEVPYVVSDSVQSAGLGLVLILALIIVNKSTWKYAFAILLVFALTPWISFYHHTFSLGIGFIHIEVTALGILILHLIVNPDIFMSFKSLLKPKPKSEEEKQAQFEASMNGFERRLNKKSTTEIKKIIEQNSLIPEAIEAVKRLIERR